MSRALCKKAQSGMFATPMAILLNVLLAAAFLTIAISGTHRLINEDTIGHSYAAKVSGLHLNTLFSLDGDAQMFSGFVFPVSFGLRDNQLHVYVQREKGEFDKYVPLSIPQDKQFSSASIEQGQKSTWSYIKEGDVITMTYSPLNDAPVSGYCSKNNGLSQKSVIYIKENTDLTLDDDLVQHIDFLFSVPSTFTTVRSDELVIEFLTRDEFVDQKSTDAAVYIYTTSNTFSQGCGLVQRLSHEGFDVILVPFQSSMGSAGGHSLTIISSEEVFTQRSFYTALVGGMYDLVQ